MITRLCRTGIFAGCAVALALLCARPALGAAVYPVWGALAVTVTVLAAIPFACQRERELDELRAARERRRADMQAAYGWRPHVPPGPSTLSGREQAELEVIAIAGQFPRELSGSGSLRDLADRLELQIDDEEPA